MTRLLVYFWALVLSVAYSNFYGTVIVGAQVKMSRACLLFDYGLMYYCIQHSLTDLLITLFFTSLFIIAAIKVNPDFRKTHILAIAALSTGFYFIFSGPFSLGDISYFYFVLAITMLLSWNTAKLFCRARSYLSEDIFFNIVAGFGLIGVMEKLDSLIYVRGVPFESIAYNHEYMIRLIVTSSLFRLSVVLLFLFLLRYWPNKITSPIFLGLFSASLSILLPIAYQSPGTEWMHVLITLSSRLFVFLLAYYSTVILYRHWQVPTTNGA